MPDRWRSPHSMLKGAKAPSRVTGEGQETLPSRELGTKTQPSTAGCSPGSGSEGPGHPAGPSNPIPSQGRG